MSIVIDDDEDQEYPIATRQVNGAVANPFGNGRSNVPAAAAAVEEQRAITEVKAAIFMARQTPRDQLRAMDSIIHACERPSLAEVAMYSYSRGGSEITGPSIRLAEAMLLAWGNADSGWRELDQSAERSTVQTYAWDLESNVRATRTFTVDHVRVTKNNTKRLTDPRDRYENMANLAARRTRACILAIIPADVVSAAIAQCDQTLRAKVKITPDLIESLLKKFAEFGVTRKALEAHIQRRFDTITPAQVVALGKKYNSLKDGMSSPADWFDIEQAQGVEGGSKSDVLKAKLTTATGTKAVTVDTHTGEVKEAVKSPAKAEPPKAAEVVEEVADPDEDIEQDVEAEEEAIDGESDFVAEDATAADEPVAAPNGIEKSMFYRTLFSVSEEYRLEPASRFRDIILAELKDAHANEITKPIFEEVKKKIIAEARKQKATRK